MPIANCIHKNNLDLRNCKKISEEISKHLNIDVSDITINFIKSREQVGKKYDLMIYLFIPSLWDQKDIENIELTFVDVLSEELKIPGESIFLITNIVQSGHVVDNKTVERW